MVIMETRRVRHDIEQNDMADLKDYLMYEVDRAWRENHPCGQMELSWNEYAVHAVVKSGDMVLSDTQYTLVKESEDYENEGVLE
jgi:hypothetical protein